MFVNYMDLSLEGLEVKPGKKTVDLRFLPDFTFKLRILALGTQVTYVKIVVLSPKAPRLTFQS